MTSHDTLVTVLGRCWTLDGRPSWPSPSPCSLCRRVQGQPGRARAGGGERRPGRRRVRPRGGRQPQRRRGQRLARRAARRRSPPAGAARLRPGCGRGGQREAGRRRRRPQPRCTSGIAETTDRQRRAGHRRVHQPAGRQRPRRADRGDDRWTPRSSRRSSSMQADQAAVDLEAYEEALADLEVMEEQQQAAEDAAEGGPGRRARPRSRRPGRRHEPAGPVRVRGAGGARRRGAGRAAGPTRRRRGARHPHQRDRRSHGAAQEAREIAEAQAAIEAATPAAWPSASCSAPSTARSPSPTSWGAARSGGRAHKGVDMMASRGTPTVAPVSGEVVHRGSSLGGLSWYVYGDNGNTYYGTHLSGYENVRASAGSQARHGHRLRRRHRQRPGHAPPPLRGPPRRRRAPSTRTPTSPRPARPLGAARRARGPPGPPRGRGGLELRSRFGLMAFHGGNLERGTDVIAAAAAERAGASLYAVRQPPGLRWHMPSVAVRPGRLAGAGRASSTTWTWRWRSTATGGRTCGRRCWSAGRTGRWPPGCGRRWRAGWARASRVVDDLERIPAPAAGPASPQPGQPAAGRRARSSSCRPGCGRGPALPPSGRRTRRP